jgi:hypothetical protein
MEPTNFSTWKFSSLVQLATDQSQRIKEQEAALEDARLALRDAMQMLRGKLLEPRVPAGYTAEELERDNPHNQWMYDK